MSTTWQSDPLLSSADCGINLKAYKRSALDKLHRERQCVLLIENRRFFRQVLIEILSRDYDIHTASNGKEGMKLYETHAPDIVFLDIHLPDCNGHQILSAMMAVDEECFVVMLTSSNRQDDIEKSLREGAKGYIVKPFTRRKIGDYISLYHSQKIKP